MTELDRKRERDGGRKRGRERESVIVCVFLPIKSVNVKSRYNDVGTDEKTHFLNNVKIVCVCVCVCMYGWVCVLCV